MPAIRRVLIPVAFALLALPLAVACSGGDKEGGGAETAPVPGVTDTEIRLGTHLPMTQTPAAAYAPIAYGMQAYFAMINDTEGGVYGRKINLIIGDDHYNPADTVEVTRRLVEENEVFAMVGGLGESTHAAITGYLEERGVPDMFISSGIERWTDPVERTRFGYTPSYVEEGRLLGDYVVRNFPGSKLGVLTENDESGVDGQKGIRRGIEGSDVELVDVQTFDSEQWDMTSQAQRLKAAGAQVVIVYSLPPQAASLVKVSREVLNWDVPVLVSGINASEIFMALAGKENVEGVISLVFGHQLFEKDNPAIKEFFAAMAKYEPGNEISNISLYGWSVAELTVELLKRSGQDLTRDNFLDAAEAMRGFNCDICLAPVNMSPSDHRPIEVEQFVRMTNGEWVPFGDVISFETTRE